MTKVLIMPKNGENEAFWGQNSVLLNFSVNLFLDFSETVPDNS